MQVRGCISPKEVLQCKQLNTEKSLSKKSNVCVTFQRADGGGIQYEVHARMGLWDAGWTFWLVAFAVISTLQRADMLVSGMSQFELVAVISDWR